MRIAAVALALTPTMGAARASKKAASASAHNKSGDAERDATPPREGGARAIRISSLLNTYARGKASIKTNRQAQTKGQVSKGEEDEGRGQKESRITASHDTSHRLDGIRTQYDMVIV